MRRIGIFVASVCLLISCGAMAFGQTSVVAHRGVWDAPASAQNSIVALALADYIGCYGSEFDVWLTGDSALVVNHDASFGGRAMETSSLQQLQQLRLANGEQLPSLICYFKAAQSTSTRLILELKHHSSATSESTAVEKIVALAEAMGLSERMEYISFSLHACREFVRIAPVGTPVFYLNGDIAPAELHAMGISGIDYHHSVIKAHPEWVEEAHALGMKVNVWTVNDAATMQWLIDLGVDLITTNAPTLLQSLL